MTYAMQLAKAARERRIRLFILPTLEGFSMSGQATGRLMDVSLVGQPLFQPGSIPVKAIVETVARAHGITADELRGPCRKLPFVSARIHAIRLIRVFWPHISKPEIGRRVGGKNHSTVINALERWPHYKTKLGREIAFVTERLGLRHDY